MGAGSGIGRACARAFAEQGAELMLVDIDGPALDQIVAKIGGTARQCDVASEAGVAQFATEALHSFGSPDVLINAAGQGYVRTLGTLRVSRALLPAMKQGGGRKDIVNIAHLGPDIPQAPFPYAASIRAFASLSNALAESVRGTNVVLTTIMPKGVEVPEEETVPDLFIPQPDLPSARRFHCELSDHTGLADKVAAGALSIHADRFGVRPAHYRGSFGC